MTAGDILDGNTLAGKLMELFAIDISNSLATCAGCGNHAPMATWAVFVSCPGFVARCSRCHAVQIRLVDDGRGRQWVDLSGVACLELTS